MGDGGKLSSLSQRGLRPTLGTRPSPWGAAAHTGSSACLVHSTETHREQGTLTLSWRKQWREKGGPWLGPGQASLSPLLLSCPPTGADSPCQSLLYQQTRREETHLSSATPPTPTLPGTKACS